jgi:aldehyde:ferredoxin oxidoreductase
MMETCKIQSVWISMDFLGPDIWAKLFTAATGVKMTPEELIKAGERAYNVERAFIAREGARRKDDIPPFREFELPYPSGPFKGQVLNREKYEVMLDEYYALHGWDKNGIPGKKKLIELGLPDVAKNLEELGLYKN